MYSSKIKREPFESTKFETSDKYTNELGAAYQNSSRSGYKSDIKILHRIMETIFSEHSMKLSDKDWIIFKQLEQVGQFQSTDTEHPFSFFTRYGITMEFDDFQLPKFDSLPYSKFKFGSKENKRTVILNSNIVKSPLGISILSWILVPCLENVQFFSSILEEASKFLNNCFVQAVSGKKAEEEPACTLLVPMGWPFWFGMPNGFIREHGVHIGNLSVLIGRPNILQGTSERIKRLVGKRNDKSNQEETVIGQLQCKDRTGEMFTLDSDMRLIYIRDIRKMNGTQISSVVLDFSFLGALIPRLKLNYKPSNLSRRLDDSIYSGFNVPVLSLDHFMQLEFRSTEEGNPITRLDWLGRLLKHKTIFPKGENNGLLRARLPEELHIKEPVDIFGNEDLRVKAQTLKSHNAQEKVNGTELLVEIPFGNGHYFIKCIENPAEYSSLCTQDSIMTARSTGAPVNDEYLIPRQPSKINAARHVVRSIEWNDREQSKENFSPISNDLG